MRKDEFLKEIGKLKYSKCLYSDDNYAREKGFDECKEQVIKLATDLDVDGLSMESLKIVRETLNETATVYGDLIKTQKELFDTKNELSRLKAERTFELKQINDLPQRYDDIIPNKIYEVTDNENT